MKKLAISVLTILCTMACKKSPTTNPPPKTTDTCPGTFVGMGPRSSKSHALYGFEIDSSQPGPRSLYFEEFGYVPGYQAYDNNHRKYYVFSFSNDSTYITQYSFSDRKIEYHSYQGADFISPRTADGLVLCSGAADKLFCVYKPYWPDSAERVCEILFEGNHWSQRTIYYAAAGKQISSPVVDERSGCIYFVEGSNLVKVDPTNNITTLVRDLNSLNPRALVFCDADGMFYGIEGRNFIRIDPGNGAVVTIAAAQYIDTSRGITGMFDNCRNCYIAASYDSKGDRNVYYIDLKTGNKIKEYHKEVFWAVACINN